MNKNFEKLLDKYTMGMSCGCVEPDYDDKPVITANWNNIPQKVFDALEGMGYACEWEDEWITCDECGKSFRLSPNSYGWEMFGAILDGYALCGYCTEWDEYLESLENQPRKALTCALWDEFKNEIESRYTLIEDEFENGFHPHQNDDPDEILEKLRKDNPNGRYIFVITGQGQFDISFAVYQRDSE